MDTWGGNVVARSPTKEMEPKTLRDEFAMAALTGLLANTWKEAETLTAVTAAIEAYVFADAMLAARQPKEAT